MHKNRYVSVLGHKINGGGPMVSFCQVFDNMWEKYIKIMLFWGGVTSFLPRDICWTRIQSLFNFENILCIFTNMHKQRTVTSQSWFSFSCHAWIVLLNTFVSQPVLFGQALYSHGFDDVFDEIINQIILSQ